MSAKINTLIIVRNQLIALGEVVREKPFIDKLLNVKRKVSYL